MDLSPSTVISVVSATASNFFFSGVFGFLFFSEPLALQWWLGATLIMSGLLIIQSRSHSASPSSLVVKTASKKED